jgi:four helix bundle protein
LAVEVYELLHECRDYGLKDQMTRSAISTVSNIPEGAERGSKAEYIRFLHIAKGSAAELRTQVYIAHRTGTPKQEPGRALITKKPKNLQHARQPNQVLKA